MTKGTAFLKGNYWHIPMASKAVEKKATEVKTGGAGRRGHTQGVIGKIGGKWKTISWRMRKEDVIVAQSRLFASNARCQKILNKIEDKLGRMVRVRKKDRIAYLRESLRKRGDKD